MSDDGTHDGELLRLLARGERSALGRLYDRHSPRLMAVALRLLHNRNEAEDVLHDVFIEAWQRAGDYDPARGTVRTWLSMRLRSRCLDRLRSPARRGRELQPEHLGETSVDELGADAHHLETALRDLPEAQRSVVHLAYFEGLSGREIGEQLDVPLGTVKSRMAAALTKLREQLGDGS